MAQSGGDDLLDLDFGSSTTSDVKPSSATEAPAAATQASTAAEIAGAAATVVAPAPSETVQPSAAAEVAAAAQPTATPASTAAAVPTPVEASAGGDAFGDDDWDTFQSAVPAQQTAPAAAPVADLVQDAPAVSPAVEHSVGAASNSSNAGPGEAAASNVGSFDPLVDVKPDPQDPFANLDTLAGKDSDNLISLSAENEFDPVAQKWAKDAATAQQPSDLPAALAVAEPASSAPPAQTSSDVAASSSAAPAATGGGDDGDLLGLGGVAASAAPQSAEQAGAEEPGADDLEDMDKKMIYVYYKGEKNVVGWYADMARADIKEAVLCACDAIIDGGFVLREVQFTGDDESTAEPKEDGNVFDYEQFDQLENGQTYIIEASKEREDLKKFTGDRWRRLKVQVDPLLHVEANKAIDRMRRGSNLLKHTHYGFPHLRQFQLSDDRKRLVWYSGAKRKEDSVVNLDQISEIRLGQTTPVFLHYRLPMLEHLSFSLVYGPKGSKTLDLTCKDEFEFDHWVTGLKAVFYHHKNRLISKEELLGHSKRFRKALEKNNVGIKLTKLPEVKEKGHVGLDDCIEIVTHTPQQLDTKMERLRERLKTMSQQVARLDHHSTAEMEVDLSLLTGQGPAYASVFVDHEDAQDEEMEIRRMHELVDQTTQVLQQARNELISLNQRQKSESSGSTESAAKTKKKENAACKHIDQLLWKAEVDLENVEDMYLRHIDNQKETVTPFSVSLADMNQRLSRAASDIEETFKSWFSR